MFGLNKLKADVKNLKLLVKELEDDALEMDKLYKDVLLKFGHLKIRLDELEKAPKKKAAPRKPAAKKAKK